MSNAIKITKYDANEWDINLDGEIVASLERSKCIDQRAYWTRTATEAKQDAPWSYFVVSMENGDSVKLGEFKTHAAAKKAAIAFFAAKA